MQPNTITLELTAEEVDLICGSLELASQSKEIDNETIVQILTLRNYIYGVGLY
jgi:hypothetical protein